MSEPAPAHAPVGFFPTNVFAPFPVAAYRVKGDPALTNTVFCTVLERNTGTNTSLTDVVLAASELQSKYRENGFTNVNITIGTDQVTNGVVILNVFRGRLPQICLDGKPCLESDATRGGAALAATAAPGTNARATTQAVATAKGTAPTNAPVGFLVNAYEITGDTLLTEATLLQILEKYTGTNITVADIVKAGTELQKEYRDRGFPTVKVTIPPQKMDSNAIVKIRVFEGRLSTINVVNNRYFSSNNIMRSLPSLRTNTILLEPIFQAELDRANANQDRQIYPEIGPGPTEGTSVLDLKVKDRLPLHAKVDFNNQYSPGTPSLRLNTSMVYNNLWQYEHSIGFQYGFSPTDYKSGDQWPFYDRPLVANYGGFYRLPLGQPAAVAAKVSRDTASFGYDEATRKFRLPAPSGQAELNFFASRSTIDTALMTLFNGNLFNEAGNSLDRQDLQQDLTITSDVGSRLTVPLVSERTFQSGISAGLDYKTYEITSMKTNIFKLTSIVLDTLSGSPVPRTNINVSTVASPVPTTERPLEYLPLSFRYNASLRDGLGGTVFGLGLGVNPWYSGSQTDLHILAGSAQASGHWVTLTPSLSRDFIFHTNWTLSLNASGQWSSEPLISNEQFGVGGVGNVRGYHEGEAFGNSGWWATLEQKTPPHVIGRVYGRNLLSVRGSLYWGYGQAFSLHSYQDLSGAGFGGVASIGANWEARFLFSWPLISTPFTRAGQPRFDFGLSAQF